ncbi:MAG TPA: 2-amino-4-hydroxy-6-hydroxymethyldihydropteridine diphosphokinase [Frankiaceae bacterium]|jgi:dihydroneopterin aldolase/2-amino-4-hydroxy-6-hydroxymethyldihydropteridine diphosphokinase|nr:2-amino-4-hydroxy-6-hydroxymethyldihydropteridine diphosphokinase [Frankiaceae bacterium]
MAEIRLRGLRVRGFHGVLDHERRDGQDFLIDATLEVSDPARDDLALTADYGTLAEQLAAVVAGEPVDLIETLAQRLLAVCQSIPGVRRSTVRVHKPQAPIPLTFDDVSVTVRSDAVAALGLGSNIGDRLEHLQAAVDLLAPLAVSPVWETAPVGGPEQGPYLNAVVLVAAIDPMKLLRQAQAIEAARDRVRAERWGPRTLDVDLLDVGGMVLDTPELTLPHPRAAYRTFVMAPWLDVAPEAVIAGHGRVSDLLQRVGLGGVRRTGDRLVQ